MRKSLFSASSFLILLALIFLPDVALGQTVNIDMGEKGGSAASQMIGIMALLTVLSLAPSILMMVTSFTRIIVVFSLLRSALGIQQTPPNSVLISLALFLTAFIMGPTFEKSYNDGIVPLMDEKITAKEALPLVSSPFHLFMRSQVREDDVALFAGMAEDAGIKDVNVDTPETLPFRILIPAFMISELRRSFEIGFLVFVPFLIIDMMVASTLMSMGMMMLPPVLISLPFKLIFFVLVDGWHMLSESLVKSFGVGV